MIDVYHKHQNSIEVLYIDTTMPNHDSRRQLKGYEQLQNLKDDFTVI